MPNTMHTETAVIIPNFNGKEVLSECLASLKNQSYKNLSLVVVDDGSVDNSIEIIQKECPEAIILENKKNIGFATSVNKGIRYALTHIQPKYIAFLNNDTEVHTEWLDSLVRQIQSHPKLSGLTSNMLFYTQRDVVNSQGCTLSPLLDGQDIHRNKKMSEVTCPQHVLGCCFGAALVRTSVISDVGMLDERYHSYAEDIDWGWRANILGHDLGFCEKAVVYHRESYTSNTFFSSYFKTYHCKKNTLCNLIKNLETKNLFVSLLLLSIYYPLFSIGYIINIKRSEGSFKKVCNLPLKKRVRFAGIPFLSILWNIKNLPQTIRSRRDIQKRRMVSDVILVKKKLLPFTV